MIVYFLNKLLKMAVTLFNLEETVTSILWLFFFKDNEEKLTHYKLVLSNILNRMFFCSCVCVCVCTAASATHRLMMSSGNTEGKKN